MKTKKISFVILTLAILLLSDRAIGQQVSQTLNFPLTVPPAPGMMSVERTIRSSLPGFDQTTSRGFRSVKIKKQRINRPNLLRVRRQSVRR